MDDYLIMPITINGSGTLAGISTGGVSDTKAVATAAQPAGSIIQVVNALVTGIQTLTFSGAAWIDTDVTAAITPSSASNKILVSMHVCGEGNTTPAIFSYQVTRAISGGATTAITAPTAGSRVSVMGIPASASDNNTVTMDSFTIPNYYDSPATTSAVTYTMQIHYGGSAEWHLNRQVTDTDASGNRRGMSWVTLMEVVG